MDEPGLDVHVVGGCADSTPLDAVKRLLADVTDGYACVAVVRRVSGPAMASAGAEYEGRSATDSQTPPAAVIVAAAALLGTLRGQVHHEDELNSVIEFLMQLSGAEEAISMN